VRYSVGVVGLKEHVAEAEALRRELRPDVYLWVNAYKRAAEYYAADDLDRLTAVDPLFPVNNVRHPSRGLACRAGASVVSVDGDGTVRRCHFIKTPIGNIYEPGWEQALRPTLCTNETCGCHIGYVHMPSLGLYDVFGDGVLERVLERVPAQVPPARTAGERRVAAVESGTTSRRPLRVLDQPDAPTAMYRTDTAGAEAS
jgi:hypothetical protein